MTEDKLRFFTDQGNVFAVTASDVAECKLKDRGTHAASLLNGLGKDEKIVSMLVFGQNRRRMCCLFLSKDLSSARLVLNILNHAASLQLAA